MRAPGASRLARGSRTFVLPSTFYGSSCRGVCLIIIRLCAVLLFASADTVDATVVIFIAAICTATRLTVARVRQIAMGGTRAPQALAGSSAICLLLLVRWLRISSV